MKDIKIKLEGVDDLDQYGQTKLIAAVRAQDFPLIKNLIESGSDINKQSKGDSPLSICLNRSPGIMSDIRDYLLLKGVDINAPHGIRAFLKVFHSPGSHATEPLLITESGLGNIEAMELLIKNNANLNLINDSGYSALTVASLSGQSEAVKLLMSKNADITNTIKNLKKIKKAKPFFRTDNNEVLASLREAIAFIEFSSLQKLTAIDSDQHLIEAKLIRRIRL